MESQSGSVVVTIEGHCLTLKSLPSSCLRTLASLTNVMLSYGTKCRQTSNLKSLLKCSFKEHLEAFVKV